MEILQGYRKILFIGKEHITSYDIARKNWNCDCLRMSVGHDHDKKPCKHVVYCIEAMAEFMQEEVEKYMGRGVLNGKPNEQ
jgi:hypothetical protein